MMQLVPEWRRAWRMWSVQILAVIALIPQIWEELPPEVQLMIPAEWHPHILTVVAVATIIARLVKQSDA